MSELITGGQWLGGHASAEGNDMFQAKDPITGASLEPSFREASIAEVDQAVRTASKAFKVYGKIGREAKANFLEEIGKEIMALGEVLINRAMSETALPQGRLEGERGRTVNQLRLFAEIVREGSWVDARIDQGNPDRQPLPKPDIRHMLIPLGPVGIFGASNFPLAFSVAGGDTASALAAGCTVVVKGHPAHPGTSELVGQAILKAAKSTGMPEGVFSLVQGTTHQVGLAIVNHPRIKAIGFTGSFQGGKAIYDAAVRRPEPIPVYAEMGSTNPVFILPEAMEKNRNTIAEKLAGSISLGVGQFCTNPGLVISLDADNTRDFIEKTGEHLAAGKAGTMLTEGIRKNYLSGIKQLSSIGQVSMVANGQATETATGTSSFLLQADATTLLTHEELSKEVFGPSSVMITAQSKDEILSIARNLEGHLTATIHAEGNDLEEFGELIEVLERKVGRILLNGYPTGVEVCHAMVHGGPFPATTDSRSTSVGTTAIGRFSRPICYQNFPENKLPEELRDGNPAGIWRMLDGQRGQK